MPAIIEKHLGAGKDFANAAAFDAFIQNNLNLVALDSILEVVVHESFDFPMGDKPFVADETRFIRMRCADSFLAALQAATVFDSSINLPTVRFPVGFYGGEAEASVHFKQLKLLPWSEHNVGVRFKSRPGMDEKIHTRFDQCIVLDSATARFQFGQGYNYVGNRTQMDKCLVIAENRTGTLFSDQGGGLRGVGNQFVARGAALGNAIANQPNYGGSWFKESIFIGFSPEIVSGNVGIENCFTNNAVTAGQLNGFTHVPGAGALVMNETNNLRLSASSPAKGAARDYLQYTQDFRGLNMGADPDAGAWDENPQAPAATFTPTSKTINGQQVIVSGTTTNSPTAGKGRLTKTARAYNNGVDTPEVDLTFGAGTFSVTFDATKVGEYNFEMNLPNGGTYTGNIGVIEVKGAEGTVTEQLLNQPGDYVLVLKGTTTGNPTSGMLYVPAATSNPNGAVSAGPFPITLGAGTFEAKAPNADVVAGNYGKPYVTFTTAAGTSFPSDGVAQAFSLIGISGDPEAPPPPGEVEPPADSTAPTVTSATVENAAPTKLVLAMSEVLNNSIVTPTSAFSVTGHAVSAVAVSGSAITLTLSTPFVFGEVAPVVSYAQPASNGARDLAGLLLASFSNRAITNNVAEGPPPPGPTPTATDVVLLPESGVFDAATLQLSWTVLGDNNPPQTVALSTTAGSVSPSGLVTRPAKTNVQQTFSVTAASTLNPSAKDTSVFTVPALNAPPPPVEEPEDPPPVIVTPTPTYKPTAEGQIDATQYINRMQLSRMGRRGLEIMLDAMIDDINSVRQLHNAAMAQLDADPGVSATDYVAKFSVLDKTVRLGK